MGMEIGHLTGYSEDVYIYVYMNGCMDISR